MLKHNRNKNLRSDIPVGLPLDVEEFAMYMRARHPGITDLTLEYRFHEYVKCIESHTATDEDLS